MEKAKYKKQSAGKKKERTIEEKKKELFKIKKTIRDPIHGDIKLTKLEVDIIDTSDFQRLRRLKQLGTTYLVYPGAHHTRFEHSLGVLYMTQKMIDEINNNPHPVKIIKDHERLLVRLCALLHDLAHIPFGHTLEDEGGLFYSQWKSKYRLEKFLGEKSPIAEKIHECDILKELSKLGLSEFDPNNIINELKKLLSGIENSNQKDNLAYLGDLVGNTLCADLLDYLKRDSHYTGLRLSYDIRLLSYLYITESRSKLVLRTMKMTRKKKLRGDIFSELLTFLNQRYILAERVYYHHAKIATSAMVISAVTDMIMNNLLDEKIITDMTDESLLIKMKEEGSEAARYLADNILNRKIYEMLYCLKLDPEKANRYNRIIQIRKDLYGIEEDIGDELEMMTKKRGEGLWNEAAAKSRWELERSLEEDADSASGTVVIYCPGPEMGHKVARTWVDWGGSIYRLDKIPKMGEEISSIVNKHKALWMACVFVDRGINDYQKDKVYRGFNEYTGLSGTDLEWLDDADNERKRRILEKMA